MHNSIPINLYKVIVSCICMKLFCLLYENQNLIKLHENDIAMYVEMCILISESKIGMKLNKNYKEQYHFLRFSKIIKETTENVKLFLNVNRHTGQRAMSEYFSHVIFT